MIKLLTRILKRNHQLYKENRLYKRLNICLIRDNDNAFQRNLKAIDFLDNIITKPTLLNNHTKAEIIGKTREILTTFKTENILDEVNGGKNENN